MWGLTKFTLSPLLVAQGLRVRKQARVLPEADGPREGLAAPAGTAEAAGEPLRLLVLGDSSAAGVGVTTQDEALAGPLARELALRLLRPVAWQLLARTGLTTQDALPLLRQLPPRPCDAVLVVLGMNDVLSQVPPARAVRERDALWLALCQQCRPRLVLWSATPPLEHFQLLPWPLRSVLGRDAQQLNRAQATWAPSRQVVHVELPAEIAEGQLAASELAEDGFHPGAGLYARWARHLGHVMAQRLPAPQRAAADPFLSTASFVRRP
ncbi:SGNH/GDSL hydrolase family protein [Aquabacterium sp. A7-Y]|uniref:SGNH/GDSL hydrolase family protein n=1 Tax=Aquabacterium sp. A7-Y TaxID=1349605 RepID=UPI00223E6C8E|nr:SGNH/GDSL hydrolase family protein [Aquabacterium sp. A7-Y]MCW7537102.1 SGNH/GDSL hydrolase family protein [Aquabacterium sp. A7-Y]